MTTNDKELVTELISHMGVASLVPDSIATSQAQHRLNLLASWFNGLDNAKQTLAQSRVLEIGCGQGDMTAALAYMISLPVPNNHVRFGRGDARVVAVDPAPLDYGSPLTLGEAQAMISRSKLGSVVGWHQREPMDYVGSSPQHYDYIVLAHSIFYLPSADYLRSLLNKLRETTFQKPSSPAPRLLLAEWGMRASASAAQAHLLAAEAQLAAKIAQGNIRTIMSPDQIKEIALGAGWSLDHENWLVEPRIDDGAWEVSTARKLLDKSDVDDQVRKKIIQMDDAVRQNPVIACMDVWTSVWTIKP